MEIKRRAGIGRFPNETAILPQGAILHDMR